MTTSRATSFSFFLPNRAHPEVRAVGSALDESGSALDLAPAGNCKQDNAERGFGVHRPAAAIFIAVDHLPPPRRLRLRPDHLPNSKRPASTILDCLSSVTILRGAQSSARVLSCSAQSESRHAESRY